MFEQLSYKLKFKLLIAVSVMLSIAAYRRSFSSLIDVINENRSLKSKLELMNRNSKSIDQLNSEIAKLDKMIGKDGVSKEKVQQGIVGYISENCGEVSINDMKPTHEFIDNNYKIYTYEIDLVGNFNQLIRCMYLLEKKFDYSKIVSSNFYATKKDNKNNVLHLKIIFQNYENYN